MSKKNRSMKRTQEDRIAAMVNNTVTISHAHRYSDRAWSKLGLMAPVVGSVYAARIPVPGK